MRALSGALTSYQLEGGKGPVEGAPDCGGSVLWCKLREYFTIGVERK